MGANQTGARTAETQPQEAEDHVQLHHRWVGTCPVGPQGVCRAGWGSSGSGCECEQSPWPCQDCRGCGMAASLSGKLFSDLCPCYQRPSGNSARMVDAEVGGRMLGVSTPWAFSYKRSTSLGKRLHSSHMRGRCGLAGS